MAGDGMASRMLTEYSNQMAKAIADIERPITSFTPNMPMRDFAEYSLCAASSTIEVLRRQVRDFEARLSEHEAVLLMMIGGPSGVSFFPTRIWAEDPDKIAFEGVDTDAHPFLVVQHVSQLNFALRSSPLAKDQTRQPIGFVVPE